MFKWIPGPLDKKFAREENRWQPIGEVVQEQAGRLVWRYQAAAPGDVLDVICSYLNRSDRVKYKGTKIVKLCLLRLFLCSKWEFFERLAAIGIFDLSGFHLVKRKSGNSSRVA